MKPSLLTFPSARLGRVLVLAGFAWIAASGTGQAQTCGLLTNSGFESGLTGWTVAGTTSLVNDAHSGTRAASTRGGPGGLTRTSPVPIVAGQEITFQAWAKISGSPSSASVGLDFLNAAGTKIGEVRLTVSARSYTLRAATRTVPAGATAVRVWTSKTGSRGTLFVDDLCLTVAASAGTCGALANPGFENGLTGWTNNGNTSLSADVRTGASAVVTGTGQGGIHYGSTVPASGGQTIQFSVWAKVSGAPAWAGVGIDYLDASGAEIGEAVLNITATSYTPYSVTAAAPPGTARLNVWTWKSGSTGNLFLDDFCLTATTPPGGGSFDVTVDKAIRHQTIDGFGFFGAMNTWWSSASSLWSDAWGEQVISDLGITIWRNEYYPPADQYTGQDANWAKQLPVVRGLKSKADQHGVDLKFIFTVWSPPSSMKVKVENNTRLIGTPHPFGTKQGGALDPTAYTAFATWLKDGIQLYLNEGIEPYAISPQNEPFFVQSFNSCWYKQEWYPEMLVGAIPQVKAAFPNVKIFGSEGMLEMEAADHNWPWFYHKQILDNPEARRNVDILAVHGYSDGVAPTSGSTLGHLWASHKSHFADPMGQPQWMTETSGYQDSWTASPGAFSLGLDMMSGLNNGNMSGWVWWQGSENPGSSSIGPFALMNGAVKGKKYYVSKQFYRYIRPGAVRVGAMSANPNVFVSAFQHGGQGTHTIVLANTSTSAQTVTVGGAGLPGSFTIYRTSATDNAADVGTYATGTSLSLPGRSIVTLQAGGTPLATALSRPEDVNDR